MYTLDLSGHDDRGKAGVARFGGLFLSVKDAEEHGRAAAESPRLIFQPSTLWVRNEENEVVSKISLRERGSMTINSKSGRTRSYACGGASDQAALIYAGKIVEAEAHRFEPDASVTITKDGDLAGC